MNPAEYLEVVKTRLITDAVVASVEIRRERSTLADAHLRARLELIDGSTLQVLAGALRRELLYHAQSHPDDPTLQSTHPHHKHIPPDIKHHRVPAPELSFARANLPVLIQEIERLLEQFTQPR